MGAGFTFKKRILRNEQAGLYCGITTCELTKVVRSVSEKVAGCCK